MVDYLQFQFTSERHPKALPKAVFPLQLSRQRSLDQVAASPLAVGNLMFVSFLDGALKALDADSGDALWTRSLGTSIDPSSDLAGELIADGERIVANHNEKLFMFSHATGESIHVRQGFLSHLHTGTIVEQSLICRIHENGESYMWCFDLENFEERWRFPVDTGFKVLAANKDWAVTIDNRFCYGISVSTGNVVWKVDFVNLGAFTSLYGTPRVGAPGEHPILHVQTVILPVKGQKVVALDVATGLLRWETPVQVDNPSYRLSLDAATTLHLLTGLFYYRIDATDGRILEKHRVESELHANRLYSPSSHLVTDRYLYAFDINNGNLVAFNLETKKVDWRHELQSRMSIHHPPQIIQDRLYVLTYQKVLTAFESPGD